MISQNFRNDPMFLRNQFESEGVFEIPKIQKDEISLENVELIGYDKISENEKEKNKSKIVHFFLDDYKFNVIWNDPEPRIEKLRQYRAVLSPNFSIYTEMPLSLKVYNSFKSRWCGAYLQSKGIKIIPTLAWGEPNTYWFCFDGIAKGSIVAVSTLGVRTEKTMFMQGYDEMLRKIKPEKVICYGKPFEEMKGKIIEVDYAETNNFRKTFVMQDSEERETDFPSIINGMQITKTCENFTKGMGSASGGGGGKSLPVKGKKNSKATLYKNGKKVQERTYDSEGRAQKDIDYTDHGNPTNHPDVPHEHNWDWSDPNHPKRR